jgi:hypothetical protein
MEEMHVRTIVGAYPAATQPFSSEEEFRGFVDEIVQLPGVDGLEIPFTLADSHWNTLGYLRSAPQRMQHVLTLIPAMVSGMAGRSTLGLASIDHESRAAALDIVRRSRAFVADVNAGDGGQITTVELHSAPQRHDGSVSDFARSLEEIQGWDWGGVTLSVEHCDAGVEQHPPAKGFLTLEEELSAVDEWGLGIVINWGRSVIEARAVSGALDHIAFAAEHGRLRGVVFSGCTGSDSDYGPAWADVHAPMSGWSDREPHARHSHSSLLTRTELDRCVRLALGSAHLEYLGVKVKDPNLTHAAERVELVARNLRMLTDSIAAARSDQ